MTEPLIRVTVHDQFKRGDKVRLVHIEGREFVTDAALAIERDSASVTFAGVPGRTEFQVIVDRTETAAGSVTIEQFSGASAEINGAQIVQHFNGIASLATWKERPSSEEPAP